VFPDNNSTTDALPTSPQVSVQVPIQARAALPAPDPLSPSWALQESLQQAAAKPVRRSARLNPTADAGSGGEDIADALDTANAPWWPGSEVSQSNIITRKRTRIRRDNPNFQTHYVKADDNNYFQLLYINNPYINAIEITKRFHRTQMPPEPRNWSEAQKHLLAQDFLVAIQKELADIKRKKSYIIVDESEAQAQNRQILPLMWVFTYKFDENGHYLKAKARLVVRGDLQPRSKEENRATTTSARVL
jgi:hypothetical protein